MICPFRNRQRLHLACCLAVALIATWPGTRGSAQPATAQPTLQTSPLLQDPATDEALFDAIVLMVDLARPGVALQYLEELLARNPGDATLLKIRDKHGPAVFLKLANIEALQPASLQLLTRMNASFRRFAADVGRIDRLIIDLGGPAGVRDAAVLQLRSGGPLVVPRLIEQIGDITQPAVRELLVYTLVQLGRPIVPPLLGVLESNDANLRATALQVLGRVGDRAVAGRLWYYAVSAAEPPGVRVSATQALARLVFGDVRRTGELNRSLAQRELEREARRHLLEPPPTPQGVRAVLWRIDVDGRLVRTETDPGDAHYYIGSRLGQQALGLSPESPRLQSLFLSLILARDRSGVAWTEALPLGEGTAFDLALMAGSEMMMRVLGDSLQEGSPAAAVGALQVLRQLASRHDLVSRGRVPSPLVSALNYPDSRVQFAAAMTIVELDPPRSFQGSSRVVAILGRALVADSAPRAVLSGPRPVETNTLAGLIDEAGYRTILAGTGRDAFKIAAARDDVQLIVLDANVIRWSLSETVANLRADARTAMIPIVVVGDERRIAAVERLRSRYPLMTYLSRPANREGLSLQLDPFLASIRTEPLSATEKAQRAAMAVSLLTILADGRRSDVFDLRPVEEALHTVIGQPDLAAGAVFALAAIPTTSAQDRLAATALQSDLDSDIREAAAAHLAFHIQKHGLLLASSRVTEIRTGWQAATRASMKSAFAGVLGTLQPDAARVGQRLRQFRVPPPR